MNREAIPLVLSLRQRMTRCVRQAAARTHSPRPGTDSDAGVADPPDETPTSGGRRFTWAAMALIAMAGVAAYSNSFHGPFIFDDPLSIAKNPTIRSLWRLDDVLLPSPQLHLYRPTMNLTLAVCYAIGGLDVVAYHVLNLAIHILAALVLFGVTRRTLLLPALAARFGAASTGLGLAVSLLWMLHPLQTESVTYVVQRCEALMGLFCLLTRVLRSPGCKFGTGLAMASGGSGGLRVGNGGQGEHGDDPLPRVAVRSRVPGVFPA